jgi:hypothetical protein
MMRLVHDASLGLCTPHQGRIFHLLFCPLLFTAYLCFSDIPIFFMLCVQQSFWAGAVGSRAVQCGTKKPHNAMALAPPEMMWFCAAQDLLQNSTNFCWAHSVVPSSSPCDFGAGAEPESQEMEPESQELELSYFRSVMVDLIGYTTSSCSTQFVSAFFSGQACLIW